jgi:hypothetical protein
MPLDPLKALTLLTEPYHDSVQKYIGVFLQLRHIVLGQGLTPISDMGCNDSAFIISYKINGTNIFVCFIYS